MAQKKAFYPAVSIGTVAEEKVIKGETFSNDNGWNKTGELEPFVKVTDTVGELIVDAGTVSPIITTATENDVLKGKKFMAMDHTQGVGTYEAAVINFYDWDNEPLYTLSIKKNASSKERKEAIDNVMTELYDDFVPGMSFPHDLTQETYIENGKPLRKHKGYNFCGWSNITSVDKKLHTAYKILDEYTNSMTVWRVEDSITGNLELKAAYVENDWCNYQPENVSSVDALYSIILPTDKEHMNIVGNYETYIVPTIKRENKYGYGVTKLNSPHLRIYARLYSGVSDVGHYINYPVSEADIVDCTLPIPNSYMSDIGVKSYDIVLVDFTPGNSSFATANGRSITLIVARSQIKSQNVTYDKGYSFYCTLNKLNDLVRKKVDEIALGDWGNEIFISFNSTPLWIVLELNDILLNNVIVPPSLSNTNPIRIRLSQYKLVCYRNAIERDFTWEEIKTVLLTYNETITNVSPAPAEYQTLYNSITDNKTTLGRPMTFEEAIEFLSDPVPVPTTE